MLSILALGAIWGSSFLFMRLTVPEIGSYWTVTLRIVFGALFLLTVSIIRKNPLHFQTHWRHYCVVGFSGMAFPFFMYAYASQTLPAGYMAVLNATVPYWASVLGVIIFNEAMGWPKLVGLVIGLIGVAVLVQLGHLELNLETLVAVAACLIATLCYALCATYIKKYSQSVPALTMSTGAMVMASLMLLPFAPWADRSLTATPTVWISVICLGMLCSGIAYLIYLPLIERMGLIKSSLVTFAIPVFAFLWGVLFLGEMITLRILLGVALVLGGTALVLYIKKP